MWLNTSMLVTMGKHTLVEQPTARPTAKITAAAIGGGVVTVALVIADLATDFDPSAGWGGLLAFAAAVASGYLKKSRASEA